MKKLINKLVSTIFISIAFILMLTGCNQKNNENGTTIVCTIFPIYDWVCEITEGADDVNVILLSENGADMHSFQPTVKNVVDIADCDIFIYVGGESEEWINDCISQNPNPDRVCINLMEYLEEDVLEESHKGIVQSEHDHEHAEDEHGISDEHEHADSDYELAKEDEHSDGDHGLSGEREESDEHEQDHEEGEIETDEHVWLSLRRSAKCVEFIADEIAKKSNYSDLITANADAYSEEIMALDNEYREYFESTDRTLYVLDRFPFGYLASDYDVDYMAIFSGCTTDANATFQTVIKMSDYLKGTNENTVYITESGKEELAQTIIDQSGETLNIRVIDSIQTVSLAKFKKDGRGYLEYMRDNLKVIKGE